MKTKILIKLKDGKCYSLTDLSKKFNTPYYNIYYRYTKYNKDIKKLELYYNQLLSDKLIDDDGSKNKEDSECYCSFNSKILNDSLNEIINIIKTSSYINKINLLDYENLVNENDLSSYIYDDKAINIFFYNACIYSNEYFKLIKNSKSYNISVLTYDISDQLVDHLILYYLGALNSIFNNIPCNIISKDNGYIPLLNILNNKNNNIINPGNINKINKYKFSLAMYMKNHNKLKTGLLLRYSDFRIYFKNFLCNGNKRINENTINKLIQNLLDFNFISESKSIENSYIVKLIEVNKYIKSINS